MEKIIEKLGKRGKTNVGLQEVIEEVAVRLAK